jgi:hypothetical protein
MHTQRAIPMVVNQLGRWTVDDVTVRFTSVMLAFVAVAVFAVPLTAQRTSIGRLEGVITGTIRAPSVGASISVTRLDSEPALSFDATADDRGRYRFDSLPAGRYMLELSHTLVDSLGLSLPVREVNVVAGETVQARLSLPTGAALRDAVCRGLALSEGRGAIVGHVIDADTDQPLGGADVAIAWSEANVVGPQEREGWVRADPRGEYVICDIPTDGWLVIQPQFAGRAGAPTRLSVARAEGVIVRNLALSATTSPTFAALDSMDDALERRESRAFAGTASVTGIVRDELGRPLRDVEVRVLNARPVTRTDDRGRFLLSGLPAGAQVLAVQRIGYAAGDAVIDLRSDASVYRDVRLDRVATVDTMHVVGQRSRYAEFEDSRRHSPVGAFLPAEDIARFKATELGTVIQHLPGFTIVGAGADARVYSNPARAARPTCTEANVVIDGADHAPVNFVAPREVAGIAAYAEAAGAPAEYRAECGLIVIWTKRYIPRMHRSTYGDARSAARAPISPLGSKDP